MEFSGKFLKKISILCLLSIFSISFIYRMYDLGTNPPGLYNDELYFFLSAFTQLYHVNYLLVPGYNISDFILYTLNGYLPSILMFHTTPFAARFPVAIYGSIMVFPIFLVAFELFNNKSVALISSFFWAISPSAIVTSRVGYGVEIFPLFLFLFFLFFWMKFIKYRRIIYFTLSSAIFTLSLVFTSIGTWTLIPMAGIILYTVLCGVLSKTIFGKNENLTYVKYIISFIVSILSLWIGLLYEPYIYSLLGLKERINIVPQSFLLTNQPFPGSVFKFFIRLGYAFAPWKIFWFSEFSIIGLYYGSPVLVPSLLLFIVPFFYGSLFFIPYFYRKNPHVRNSYYLLIVLMIFGVVQPVFNITNTYYNFEPSEGIFALPFYCILSAFSFYLFLSWWVKSTKLNKFSKKNKSISHVKLNLSNKKKWISTILVAGLLIFAGINITNLSSDLFSSSKANYEDNNTTSLNYIFYGWDHVTEYLLKNNLINETIYYTPGKGGEYNLTNINNFNYWFYHQNFPLYWLYLYSGGRIKSIRPLFAGILPQVQGTSAIVLSQNASYSNLLSENGINNTVLYSVLRQNGKPAIQVIQINDLINTTEKEIVSQSKLFYKHNINGFGKYNISSLQYLSSKITVSVKFTVPYGSLKPGKEYTIIGSETPTFALGMFPQNLFFKGASNTTFVPIGTIYSNSGNYSVPHTWQRLYGNVPLVYNTTYLLTMTFYNGSMRLFLNDTLLGSYELNYPLYKISPPLIYLDYNINASIDQVGIWSQSLNNGEIWFLNYNSF